MGARQALLAVFACLLAIAPSADAAPRYAGSAAATITNCRTEGFTATGSVQALSAKTRRPAKVRGARLQLRLDAVPLFGFPRAGQWRDLGARSAGSVEETFASLPFDTWTAVIRYRYRQGRRTVLSGDRRSESRRVGRARGRAFCILPEGSKPRDTRPPALYILPGDDRWRRGPLTVTLAAADDFSGVAQVIYRLDGGELRSIRNGGTFQIEGEGAHTVEMSASDAAGNWAPSRTQALRVDAGPPSAPAVSLPRAVTASTRPEIRWGASTDSGSGVQGYHVAVKRADGSTAGAVLVGPETTSVQSPATLDNGQSYTAEVTAFDRADTPWTALGSLGFRVDTTPEVTAAAPGEGTVLAPGSTQAFTLTLDRPADPATLAGNVFLDLHPESASDPSVNVACGNGDCSAVTVTPQNALPEGRYALRLTNGVKSQEGTAFQVFTAAFSVAFFRDDTDTHTDNPCTGSPSTPRAIGAFNVDDAAENGTLTFSWTQTAGGGSWTVQVLAGGNPIGSVSSSNAANPATVTFDMPDNEALSYVVDFTCNGIGAHTLRLDNIVGTRSPARTPSFP